MWMSEFWKVSVLIISGLSAGFAVAGGVFTVFTAVGLVPRFADRINGADHILLFEDMIILGVLLGCFVSVFEPLAFDMSEWFQNVVSNMSKTVGNIVSIGQQIFIASYALLTGCYISCLALSIAEIFDAIPIMAKRTRLQRGIGIVILCFAVGKLIGALFYYGNGFFLY